MRTLSDYTVREALKPQPAPKDRFPDDPPWPEYLGGDAVVQHEIKRPTQQDLDAWWDSRFTRGRVNERREGDNACRPQTS